MSPEQVKFLAELVVLLEKMPNNMAFSQTFFIQLYENDTHHPTGQFKVDYNKYGKPAYVEKLRLND